VWRLRFSLVGGSEPDNHLSRRKGSRFAGNIHPNELPLKPEFAVDVDWIIGLIEQMPQAFPGSFLQIQKTRPWEKLGIPAQIRKQ